MRAARVGQAQHFGGLVKGLARCIIKGFSKQIKCVPAALDLSKFPDGYAFQVELKIADSTDNKSKPIIESLELAFE